jgi:hypothetical protein
MQQRSTLVGPAIRARAIVCCPDGVCTRYLVATESLQSECICSAASGRRIVSASIICAAAAILYLHAMSTVDAEDPCRNPARDRNDRPYIAATHDAFALLPERCFPGAERHLPSVACIGQSPANDIDSPT